MRLRAIVDANVFAHRRWMEPLVASARARHLELYWSPRIIAESSRVLAWLWLRKRAGDFSGRARRELSNVANRWFEKMSAAFSVAEDAPPAVQSWTTTPRDPNDAAIWSAAVRADVDFVITENLKDGPPPDPRGLRRWGDVLYVHPADVVGLLGVLGQIVEARRYPDVTDSLLLTELVRALARRVQRATPSAPTD